MKKLVLLTGLLLEASYGLDLASMSLIDHITQQHLDMASNSLAFNLDGNRCRILALGGGAPDLQNRTFFCARSDIKRAFMPDTLPLIVQFTDATSVSLTLCIDFKIENNSSRIEDDPLPERTLSGKRQADFELEYAPINYKRHRPV